MFLTDLGSKIGKDANTVYVSKDNGQSHIPLFQLIEEVMVPAVRSVTVFPQDERNPDSEDYEYLVEQLDLFGKLTVVSAEG